MSVAVPEEEHDAGADEEDEEDQRQHATAMRSRQRGHGASKNLFRRIILDSRRMHRGLARGAVSRPYSSTQGAVPAGSLHVPIRPAAGEYVTALT